MNDLIVIFLYVCVTLATFILSVLNSPLGEEAPLDFDTRQFPAIDIALLTGRIANAEHVQIVDLLYRGSARVRQTRWLRQYVIELNEPQSRATAPSVVLAKGRYRRARINTFLAADLSARREVLIEHGFLRSRRDVARTVAWTSYPLAASIGLGIFLLSLAPDRSSLHLAVTVCIVFGYVALLLVNLDVCVTPLGTAAWKAARSVYAKHLTPSPAYAVALWGPEQLRSTPYEAYADMVRAENSD